MILSLIFFLFAQGNAQIKNKIIITVGNKSITSYDLKVEIKFLNIMSGRTLEKESTETLKKVGIQSLIRRLIKEIEIEKYEDIKVNTSQTKERIKEISRSLNLTREDLEKIFVNNKVPFSILIDDITTNLKWNFLIYDIYKNKIKIDEKVIIKKLNEIKEKSFFNEYLLSEIILEATTADKLEGTINEAMIKIKNFGFEKTALEISISESSKNKGNLGWIKENTITEEILQELKKTKVGSVTEPIFVTGGILIMKVVDKRQKENKIDLKTAKEQLVVNEKNKKLDMYSISHFKKTKGYILINTH